MRFKILSTFADESYLDNYGKLSLVDAVVEGKRGYYFLNEYGDNHWCRFTLISTNIEDFSEIATIILASLKKIYMTQYFKNAKSPTFHYYKNNTTETKLGVWTPFESMNFEVIE